MDIFAIISLKVGCASRTGFGAGVFPWVWSRGKVRDAHPTQYPSVTGFVLRYSVRCSGLGNGIRHERAISFFAGCAPRTGFEVGAFRWVWRRGKVRTLPDFHFGRLDAVDAGQFTFEFFGD